MDDRALVVHLYVAARREGVAERLGELWRRLGDELGLTWPIPEIAPYELRLDARGGGEALAARQSRSRAEGVFQAVVRRRHDVLVLSVALAPFGGEDGWAELEERWARVAGDAPEWALGEARLLTGVLPEPERGHVVGGHTAVWEDEGPDGRFLRRIHAIAVAGRQDESDAWLWSRGDERLAPFAVHLSHAAKVRHHLRLREAGRYDELLERAEELLRARAAAGAADPADGLAELRRRLAGLLAGSDGLTQLATRLREMERTARIAASNMRLPAGDLAEGPGLVAQDVALAEWLAVQLSDDVLYLDAARERARDGLTEVTMAAEEAVQDRRERLQRRQEVAQRRRERIDLLQTAVLGSVLMVLAAIQAFGYRVPLPPPITPAVIGLLGSLALLLATVTLWSAGDEARGAGVAVRVFAGLSGAAVAWVGCSVAVYLLSGTAAPAWLTVTLAVPAAAAGAYVARRRR
ncbi:CATRA conflict system CASPASE/TPR repeat-associated protein [Nonomuraea sp. NPDC050536]|uniref:CATRA conflict system CASPASE/TPR repeat-associated protein n=1 Tax=Nonomuraea sp. NPDC050536 TaxID=3364366 RepID=UPI0037C5C69C